jgi:hypothetical protein
VPAQVDEADAELVGQRGTERFLGHEAAIDKDAPELAAAAALFFQGGVKLLLGEEVLLQEDFPETNPLWSVHGAIAQSGADWQCRFV